MPYHFCYNNLCKLALRAKCVLFGMADSGLKHDEGIKGEFIVFLYSAQQLMHTGFLFKILCLAF